jgi:hypothetical protein
VVGGIRTAFIGVIVRIGLHDDDDDDDIDSGAVSGHGRSHLSCSAEFASGIVCEA